MTDANLYDEDGHLVQMSTGDGSSPTDKNRRSSSLASRLLDRRQLSQLPEPSPLIDGTLDKNTVAVLAGYWGTCKSFVAQDWAASLATGTPWQGRGVDQSKVLYVAAEGAHGLDNRLTAWETAWDADVLPELLSVLPTPVRLAERNDVSELVGILMSGGFEFLVIDTLARCMPGLDENSSKDMGLIVESLYVLREAMGAHGTVLGVHHTGKDKQTVRGSSALEAGVDTVYMTEGDPCNLTLSRTKRKDGPVTDRLNLKLEQVEGTKSAVLQSNRGVGLDGAVEALLSNFESNFSATGATSTELREAVEMPKSTFYYALNTAASQGFLVNEGTDKRKFWRLNAEVTP